MSSPSLPRPPSPVLKAGGCFGLFVTGFIALVFIGIIGMVTLTLVNPEAAGRLQAQGVKAADVACREGCVDSPDPKLCYQSCMVTATNPNNASD